MSKIKELRNKQENILNLVDFFSLFCPEGKESKYVTSLLRMTLNTDNIGEYSHKIKTEFKEIFNLSENKLLESFTPIQIIMMERMVGLYEKDDLKTFQKFCDYNERGLIENNDLTKIKSFEEIKKSVGLVDVRLMEKEMSKQIHVIHRDDEWLLLRPLTYLSSKKYGANTKWCTASEDTWDQFERYTKNGVLIYCLNTKTGLKIACYREIPYFDDSRQNYEFSFWNQLDYRIDSMDSGLPNEILEKIKLEISEHKFSNFHFVKLYKLENKYLDGGSIKKISSEEPMEEGSSPLYPTEFASLENQILQYRNQELLSISAEQRLYDEDMEVTGNEQSEDILADI
jgi:hypothetical protein